MPKQGALFADLAPQGAPQRDRGGRFLALKQRSETPPSSAEIATIEKAQFIGAFNILQYPNPSAVLRYRSDGQMLRFYPTMMATDGDLGGLASSMRDSILRYPIHVRAASDDPAHIEHKRFCEFALRQIPNLVGILSHIFTGYLYGFSVAEKMYSVVTRGEWAGAVIYGELLDKPVHWWSFDPDRALRFRTVYNSIPGDLMPAKKFVVARWGSVENPWGIATLDGIYWPWFVKHNLLKLQAIFLERWALPMMKGTYPYKAGDSEGARKINFEKQKQLVEVFEGFRANGAAGVPEGFDISIMESARSGSVSFEAAIDQYTATESLFLTGGQLSNLASSGHSFSQAKVHDSHSVDKRVLVANWIASVVHEQIFTDLVTMNYGPQDEYPRADILARSAVDRQAEVQNALMQINTGMDQSEEYLRSLTQSPRPLNAADKLIVPAGEKIPQPVPDNAQLARACELLENLVERIELAEPTRGGRHGR